MHAHSLSQQPSTMPRRHCLVAYESNLQVCDYLERALSSMYDLRLFADEQEFLQEMGGRQRASLVLLAWDGTERSESLLCRLRSSRPEVPVLVLGAVGEVADYEVLKRFGNAGVVLKPLLDDTLKAAISRHLLPPTEDDAQLNPLDGGQCFVCSSQRMRGVEAQARLVARSDIPVLILGETGAGKEVMAMYTHRMSRRAERKFLKVNCAAWTPELLESELFGYEQGAFQGASHQQPGRLEICDGGTIFLDDIAEMPIDLQAKLLHVMRDGTFCRVGGRKTVRTNVRIMAATKMNLKEAVANKTFREDLYYRLNGMSLSVPPLRERLDEIPALVRYFVRKGAKEYDLNSLPISANLLRALTQYHWPGNVRELENVCNRHLILRDERAAISELDIRCCLPPVSSGRDVTHAEAGGLKGLVRDVKGDTESSVIASALDETGWNRTAAARHLKISYKALLYKIKQYELSPNDHVYR